LFAVEEDHMTSPANEPRRVVPTDQARQGETGHHVRYVLGFGLAGVVVVFAIIWLVYFA
jgi:hypothetical protein